MHWTDGRGRSSLLFVVFKGLGVVLSLAAVSKGYPLQRVCLCLHLQGMRSVSFFGRLRDTVTKCSRSCYTSSTNGGQWFLVAMFGL